jgi:hypothetical protein
MKTAPIYAAFTIKNMINPLFKLGVVLKSENILLLHGSSEVEEL